MTAVLDYQIAAKEFAKYPKEYALYYTTLGMVGEAGEVANKVKKVIRDNNGEITEDYRQSIISELGDVLWYVSAICTELNVQLTDVMFQNIEKLDDRWKRNAIGGSGDNR